ncbi:sigma 54-interacting transcriptional regulator [Desulfovibrio sp. OttesenSCG-928-I05]|nr:sigma 54-interacting transcriptional regulator [Desulfovibrio sp. OttesenSCG-928-I05]
MELQAQDLNRLAGELGKKLMNALAARASRKLFFSTLARLLQEYFHFDRLCINLYDQQGEMLTYFTAAEGTMVSTLSPVRPAESSSTVAGHVIATRKPVVITDVAGHFSESMLHPIAEAGLTATMAFPLILDNEIIATLHCSFAEKPDNMYDITSFLLELSPVVATCIGAILSLEQLRQGGEQLKMQSFSLPAPEDSIIRHSDVMREVMRRVAAVAALNIPVLILGETGTGKTLIAQEIHRRSKRKDAHFVKVNCPALAPTLFESELFGHAKGAFTGAASKRVGRFELAHGGTLFLDEIAELTPEMQSKLLQVLDDSSFERVGESVSLAVDVRIVAATNVHPGEALARGTLRSDLFHRLSPCIIELPPLRERTEDIPPLTAALSAQIAGTLGLPPVKFSSAVTAALRRYSWPGNIRELRNTISRMLLHHSIHGSLTPAEVDVMLEESRSLTAPGGYSALPAQAVDSSVPAQALPPLQAVDSASPLFPPFEASGTTRVPGAMGGMGSGTAGITGAGGIGSGIHNPGSGLAHMENATLAEVEKRHILETLKRTGGVVAGPSGAAAILGLPRSTLQHRMRKLGIDIA